MARSISRANRSIATSLLATSLTTCSAGGVTGNGGSKISLMLLPNALTVVQSANGTVTVALTRTGSSSGMVTLDFTGPLPTDVTPTFDPPSLSGNSVSSTLTFATALTSAARTLGMYVRGVSADGDTAVAQLSLTIAARPRVVVSKVGTGTGTVTSSPAGINCGNVCSAAFVGAVTLTATPASGSSFDGWTGAVCTGLALTCTFTPRLTAGNVVTATFFSTVNAP